MGTRELHLHLTLDRDADPIRGQVTADNELKRSFAGWTELFAALHTFIADHPDKEGQDAQSP